MRNAAGGLLVMLAFAVPAAEAQTPAPSSAHRLRMIVTPGAVSPGKATNVRITDSKRVGGLTTTVCAKSRSAAVPCKKVRLAPGQWTLRTRLRLPSKGRWKVVLRSSVGPPLAKPVAVRKGARTQVLFAGDSMIWGIFERLNGLLDKRGGAVTGDPQPGSGVTKPLLDWASHARQSVKSLRPDATIVFLGTAADSYPLKTLSGASVACCAPAWVAEYARRVQALMATYLRQGKGVVYWVLLPAHKRAGDQEIFRAVNSAIRLAAPRFDDGVRVVDEISAVLAPNDRFQEKIFYGGRWRVVRNADGYHLTDEGRVIAATILLRALRRDGMVGPAGT